VDVVGVFDGIILGFMLDVGFKLGLLDGRVLMDGLCDAEGKLLGVWVGWLEWEGGLLGKLLGDAEGMPSS